MVTLLDSIPDEMQVLFPGEKSLIRYFVIGDKKYGITPADLKLEQFKKIKSVFFGALRRFFKSYEKRGQVEEANSNYASYLNKWVNIIEDNIVEEDVYNLIQIVTGTELSAQEKKAIAFNQSLHFVAIILDMTLNVAAYMPKQSAELTIKNLGSLLKNLFSSTQSKAEAEMDQKIESIKTTIEQNQENTNITQ